MNDSRLPDEGRIDIGLDEFSPGTVGAFLHLWFIFQWKDRSQADEDKWNVGCKNCETAIVTDLSEKDAREIAYAHNVHLADLAKCLKEE